MTDHYILTIDAGTTSVRTVIFDVQGKIVAREVKTLAQITPQPGWIEQDPLAIYNLAQQTIADTMIAAQIQPTQIAAVAIDNQRETAIVWDKQTGLPVYNAIGWRSNQTQAIINDLKFRVDTATIQAKTGLRLDPIFSASKIRFILDHIQNGQRRAENGELLFGTVNTWLAWKLSDGTIYKTDDTNASRTLLFNIHQLNWDNDLLQLFDIPRVMLPEIVANDEILGKTSTHELYGQAIPIAAMIGSQQAALFGQTDFERGSIKATFGTGGFIVMNIGHKLVLSQNNLLTSVGYRLNGKTNYVLEGGFLTAGDAVDWFVDKLGLLNNFREADTISQSSKDADEIYFVPAFSGLAAPYWDSEMRGTFLGLTRGTTKDDLVKAAVQSIAYQTQAILTTMIQDTALSITHLRVDGGASKNDYLLQFLADVANIPVQRSQSTETTALGAAFIAGLNVGVFDNLDAVRKLNTGGKVFNPQISDHRRNQLEQGWQQAILAGQSFE